MINRIYNFAVKIFIITDGSIMLENSSVSINKSKELQTSISLINDRLHFSGTTAGMVPVSIDYTPPLGDNLGYTSLELLLLSLTSCIGSAILTFLRKMRKSISGCEINARGIRKQEHPTAFETIYISIILRSADTADEDLKKVLQLAEDTFCPVWAMVKGNVSVITDFTITK
ncbi:MAG: OsmC family protein [Ignavibacteriales bacterium]|nr:OsmC family protein [Ignavibacteriales bacterium]